MWTVGYTVGDMMYIAQTTADQRRANWFSKALWVLLLLCFLAYTGYQVYLSYLSYTNPDWSAGVKFSESLDFPTVLVCPMTRKSDPFDIKAVGCRQFNETQTTRRFCSATAVRPTEGRFKDHECALFNDDTSATVTATIEEHTFMEIGFTLAVLPIGPATPYAVILYSPRARVSPEAPSDDSPSFLVVPYTDYWTVLTQEEDVYLSGPSAITFYPSTSSSSASSTTIGSVLITFSYSSFAVGCYSQVVTYDWLSLVGVLGGAAAFCCAVHEIVMFMFSKSLTCCCPDLAKRFNDDEEDNEEEEGEGEKPKASSSRSVKTTRKGMGAAKKGDGDDSDDDDDDEDEQEAAARSLQEVGLMHHGFNRGDLVAAMYDDYGRSLSSERLPLL